MTQDPTPSAFSRLRAFALDAGHSPLDRLTTETAAAWLAHATSYGVTADAALLREIADRRRHPVSRAKTLTRELVDALNAAGLPLSAPFQAVDVLYSAIDDAGYIGDDVKPLDPFETAVSRGPAL